MQRIDQLILRDHGKNRPLLPASGLLIAQPCFHVASIKAF